MLVDWRTLSLTITLSLHMHILGKTITAKNKGGPCEDKADDDESCKLYVNKHYYCHHEWMQIHCCRYCHSKESTKEDEYCAKFWCPEEGDAVCATNGKTYSNRCKLKKAILCGKENTEEAYEGYCQTPGEPRRKCSSCLPYHQPVCATDGKTYLNDCFLQNAISCNGRFIKFLYRGRCRQSPITCPIDCPSYDHSLVCATDGYTMDTYTRCELENERFCNKRPLHSYHGGWCVAGGEKR